MVFSHLVGALEAYLSDTLINLVSDDAEAMKRLLLSDNELASKKFTLAEIAGGCASRGAWLLVALVNRPHEVAQERLHCGDWITYRSIRAYPRSGPPASEAS